MRTTWKWWNWLAYAFAIAVNYIAIKLPLNNVTTQELSARYEVPITPPGYVFSIWMVIYAGLLLFLIYSLSRSSHIEALVQRISAFFAVSCLLNGGWLIAWHYEQLALSTLIMAALLVTLAIIYGRIRSRQAQPAATAAAFICVRLPFSLYLAWITIAFIVNASLTVRAYGWTWLDLPTETWIYIFTGFVLILGGLMAWACKDPIYPLVAAWAAYGIGTKLKDTYPNGSTALLAATFALVLLAILLPLLRRRRRSRSSYRFGR